MATKASGLASHIQGLREAKAAFQKLPQVVRDNTNGAIETTASQITQGAKRRLQASPSIRTRSLLNAITYRMTKTNGTARVGVTSGETIMTVGGKKLKVKGIVVGSKTIMPSHYGWHVEKGTSKMAAEPFMQPAAEAERGPHLQRMHQAGKGIERDMSTVGGGLL